MPVSSTCSTAHCCDAEAEQQVNQLQFEQRHRTYGGLTYYLLQMTSSSIAYLFVRKH
jgi:hypothetical protein